MVRKSTRMKTSRLYFTRNTVLETVLIVCSNILSAVGQPELSAGIGIANCGDDFQLTCFPLNFDEKKPYIWKKNGNIISDTGKDSSGTGRYSDIKNATTFSLVISNAVLGDIADYTCTYEFVSSAAKHLDFECRPVSSGVHIMRDDQNRLYIQVTNVYPETENMLVSCESQDEEPINLQGNFETPTANGDHFDITWISADTMHDGNYTCTVTIMTLTVTNITKTGLIFEPPEVIRVTSLDHITKILGVLSGVLFCILIAILFTCLCQKKNRKVLPSPYRIVAVPQGNSFMLKWTTLNFHANIMCYQIWHNQDASEWNLKADVSTTESFYTVESLEHDWQVRAKYQHTREILFSKDKLSQTKACILKWKSPYIDPCNVEANQIWRKKNIANDSWELIDIVPKGDSSCRVGSGDNEYKVLALYKPIKDREIKVKYEKQLGYCILTWGGLDIDIVEKYQIRRRQTTDNDLSEWINVDSVSSGASSCRVSSGDYEYKVCPLYKPIEDQEIKVTYGTGSNKLHSATNSPMVETPITLCVPPTDDRYNIEKFQIMRTKDEQWEDVASVSNKTKSYEIYSKEYTFEIHIKSKKQNEEHEPIVPELNINGDELLLSWKSPQIALERVQEYVVMRKRPNSPLEKVGFVSNKENSYTINSKEYRWKIRTVTEKNPEMVDVKTTDGTRITLTWSVPDTKDKSYIKYFQIMRTKDEHWEDVFRVSDNTSYEIYSEEYTFEIHIKSEKQNEEHEPIKPELKRNGDALLLWWKPPQDGPVKEYVVMRKKTNSYLEKLEKIGVVSNEESSYTINSKWYKWKIRTVTEDVVEMCVDGVPGIPEDLSLRHDGYNEGLTKLHLSWKRPSSLGTSAIKYYHILSKETTGKCIWNLKQTVPAGVLRYTVNDWKADLLNGQVGVCAENEAGCGKATFKETRKDTPSTPGALSLIYISNETKLTWKPPVYPGLGGAGGITYKISKRKNDENWTEWTTVDRTDCVIKKEFILEDQKFKITPQTLYGAGDSLDTGIPEKKDGIQPGKITHVSFKYDARRHIVSWKPPVNCGSTRIGKYRIAITKITDETFKSIKVKFHQDLKGKYYDLMTIGSKIGTDPRIYSSTIPDIEAFVTDFKSSYETEKLNANHYVCSVCALNDDRCGTMTYAISQETLKEIEKEEKDTDDNIKIEMDSPPAMSKELYSNKRL